MEESELLPEEIVPSEVVGKTYHYDDLFQMLDDIQRLRRKTGWFLVVSNDAKNLMFSVFVSNDPKNLIGVAKPFVLFCFQQALLKHVDWPKSYLNIKGIKNGFYRLSERAKLIDAINAIPMDLEPGTPRSAWEHMFDDL